MTRRQWLDAATSQIRFSPDRNRVRRELADHWDDAVDAAQARGLTFEEAEARALADLGDPAAIAPELGRLHSPWLGRIWWAVRAVTAAALVILIFSAFSPDFWYHFRDWQADPLEIPPETQSSEGLTLSRTGLWEDLDLGEAGGYRFTVPLAYAQTVTVPGENGYETTSLQLQLTAETWRIWEPWQADSGCMSVTDSSGCTYLPAIDPRSAEPFTPYFYTAGSDGSAALSLCNVSGAPDWLDVTIGDAVLRIDLKGGWAG